MPSGTVVLVVDDESDLVESCRRLLRRRGYTVVSAGSCEAGRAALAAGRPTLLVSDLKLPDGDGLELVRLARTLTPPVPVILMSGYLSQVNELAAREAGAVDVLAKPFSGDTFTRAVENALEPPANA
jgi:DNA-binding NtrC family response regulator